MPSGELLEKLAQKGLKVEHYAAQDKPLFELIEGEGDKQQVKPLFSIPEILSSIKEVGRRGLQIKRFKGLGEMNPKELFETTMNPVRRKLLRIDLTACHRGRRNVHQTDGRGGRAPPPVHRGQRAERA